MIKFHKKMKQKHVSGGTFATILATSTKREKTQRKGSNSQI